ncbi:LysM peptidoglycan-binding domain-containing protein [Pseudohongiella sp.]|uniref:LysM domain-containing protein n=1 Tax=marine sediment metagenome TaxID=412755 RepID=A0A0F9W6D1_9ZZZZ|nr:LysM peptidoglycan-binding domain-containing protein [Pseudohongiella sp.]HDZ08105.1 LysM peptidoglycan-binding domain-containing protein [Pseudohongiella sp.]HEA63073.1 LysM peptidoglycan-binding domain-containing protein [Pseudohongiella sp.]
MIKTSLHRYALGCFLGLLGLLSLSAGPVQAQSEALPRPAELEPAIGFWTRVYTEVDTDSGFLHDARNLAVVYRKVDYNRREIEQFRNRIVEDLQVLATGKRTDLTLTQQQTLDAWPAGVSNTELAAAANNVRFQLGQSDRFVEGLIRSGAYREHINRIATERGLPVELGALPHVESSFHPGAYSHANAAGMWQFIRATGQRFMRIDNVVDERMDPYVATHAAMSLLEYNYNLLGQWPLALTAYNHGAGGLARAVREVGSNRIEDIIANYDGRAFGFASRNFYPQFLAVLDVERRAQALFGLLHLDAAPEYDEFELEAYIEADTLARSMGVTLEQLRFDNPALRPVVWQGGKRIPRGYTVKVQRNSIDAPLATLIERIPAEQMFAYQTPDVNYVVQRGDSLSAIAGRFDTSIGQLVALNQLDNQHRIQIGQTLLLPHDTNMATQTLASGPSEASTPELQPAVATADGSYSVRAGDTLSLIAAQMGVSESDILRLNGITDPHRIYAGQALRIPTGDEPQLTTAAYNSAVDQRTIDEPVVLPQTADASGSGLMGPPQYDAQIHGDRLVVQVMSDEAADDLAVEPDLSVSAGNELAIRALSADPSDYSVGSNATVEIQASETLGHFADWLDIPTQSLRNLNRLSFGQPLIIGERLRLDFSQIDQDEFELRRRQFHVAQQENFFRNYRIQDLARHELAVNENIASIARQRYSVPLWLLRQYNPGLDFSRVRVGQEIVFPVVSRDDDV